MVPPVIGALGRRAAPRILLTGACAMAVLNLAGCGSTLFAEKMCGGGEYPVIRGDGAGGSCVKEGEEPTDANVRYPAHHVPELAEDDYSPTLGDYLTDGDERQQDIARKQLRDLMDAHPDKTRQELVEGALFPSGYPPAGERP